ncbi:hypothetical protein M2271_008281 [Streptomyces sp. LBL]|nr:hypothetical protein [Streptomyces sp. LBL]
MRLKQEVGRGVGGVYLGDAALAGGVVVEGVDDDLALEGFGGDLSIGPDRNSHYDEVAGGRGLDRGPRAGARAESRDQVLQGFRAAAVAEDDVVTRVDCEAGERAADVAAADEADGSHGLLPVPDKVRHACA